MAQASTSNGWALRVSAQAGDSLEIDIYDVILPSGMDWMGTAVSAKSVLAQIKSSPSVKTISVRINSAGGDVYDGMAIYSMLKEHPARVEIQVDGLCASIASIIAMAGDEIAMNEGAWMMIHNPFSDMILGAGAEELRKTAETLDKFADTMATVYAKRTGQDKADVADAMTAETWMTAAEALELGYCTKINPAKTGEDEDQQDGESETELVAQLLKTHDRVPSGALHAMAKAYRITMNASARGARAEEEDRRSEDKFPPKKTEKADEDKKGEEDKKAKAADDEEDRKAKKKAKYDELKDKKKKMAEEMKKLSEDMDDLKDELDEMDDEEDEEDEESSTDEGGKKAEAAAVARLALAAVHATGAKNPQEAEARMLAIFDKVERTDKQMRVISKERHEQRVHNLIAQGKLAPSRKAWALKATESQLDTYLEATGGEQIAPIGQEYHGDPNRATDLQPEASAVDANYRPSREERVIMEQLGLSEEQMRAAAKLRLSGDMNNHIPGVWNKAQ